MGLDAFIRDSEPKPTASAVNATIVLEKNFAGPELNTEWVTCLKYQAAQLILILFGCFLGKVLKFMKKKNLCDSFPWVSFQNHDSL